MVAILHPVSVGASPMPMSVEIKPVHPQVEACSSWSPGVEPGPPQADAARSPLASVHGLDGDGDGADLEPIGSGSGSSSDQPQRPRATLLVVDDEPAVRRVLVMRLQLAGYHVVCAEDGEQALALFHQEQPDLVVLDVMLPKLDGFAVCRRLRAESCVPIIFLSALDAISERVAGLDLGADDYLPKPFSPKELEARIATILRRFGRGSATAEPREQPSGSGVMRVGDLVVDTNRRQVTRDGARIALTYTEFSLLELLFREPGRVVPRAEILEQLWGYPPRRAADLRVVDVYVARLRGKLEPDPRNPELILTVRGTGYASQRMGDNSLAAAG
jgi:DNA-binding response OmpR family regulator